MTLKYGDVSFVLKKLSVLSLTGRVCILAILCPSPSPGGCFSSRLVASSSWDRLVDNLVFSDSPALQKTQREPISDVLVLKTK